MSEYLPEHGTGGLPLFAPDPPTGPKGTEYTTDDGKWEKFQAFRHSDAGRDFWRWLTRKALDAQASGAKRFSVRTWTAFYRDTFGVGITNDFTPWLADELVATYPALLDIIQRKSRTKAK